MRGSSFVITIFSNCYIQGPILRLIRKGFHKLGIQTSKILYIYYAYAVAKSVLSGKRRENIITWQENCTLLKLYVSDSASAILCNIVHLM